MQAGKPREAAQRIRCRVPLGPVCGDADPSSYCDGCPWSLQRRPETTPPARICAADTGGRQGASTGLCRLGHGPWPEDGVRRTDSGGWHAGHRRVSTWVRGFFFPRLTWRYGRRVLLVALVTAMTARYILVPCRIQGASMEPAYRDGGVALIWRGAFLLREPGRGQVVAIRAQGTRVMFLKRVVALAGQSVAFRDGTLLLDGMPVEEPYVRGPCNWELPERRVSPDCVYLVGDNRSMPMEQHIFGETERRRLAGVPVW
ncbi:MAG: signal peptidase I [Lentisphaeria bacterium]|nr:signal peptidase I [Lentisphaeria bacterium]